MKKLLIALVALIVVASPADARHRRHHSHHHRMQHRHTEVSGRPHAWCGWWLMQHLGLTDRSLWLAANWRHYGSNAGGPGVGVIVVWPHHVGILTGQSGGEWIMKSGNDGNAVRERPRSLRGVIAFRRA